MVEKARQLHPPTQRYSGRLTRPEKWAQWQPNIGDIVVCTPSKCGTTWTQSIIAMLLYGTVDLPDRVSALSPWLDSALGDADLVAQVPASPSGRRLIKTHSPADGFAVFEGVRVVAVYRHPLDVFLSIRRHVMNMKGVENPVLCGPMPEALTHYLTGVFEVTRVDRDNLATVVEHYLRTINRAHQRGLVLLHYANMIADHRGAVAQLAEALEITHDAALIDAVTDATRFTSMKADAVRFAPEGGKGFWHDDASFFDSGGTHKWQGTLSDRGVAQFEDILQALLPDPEQRAWLNHGS